MDIHYTIFPGRELSCQREYVEHFINARVEYVLLPGDTNVLSVLFWSVFCCCPFKVITIRTAWFRLTAPLFILDQCVNLTARRGQGEGGREEEAVLLRLTAKGVSFMADFKIHVCFSVLLTVNR